MRSTNNSKNIATNKTVLFFQNDGKTSERTEKKYYLKLFLKFSLCGKRHFELVT